jgi:radical SAM superfamily enzyme YgiQ (UPF0313 family)
MNHIMEHFDNTKPNIVILTDKTDIIGMEKAIGVYRAAFALRDAGFEVAVINHLHVFSLDELKHILSYTISAQTLFVGVNNFNYVDVSSISQRDDGGVDLKRIENGSILPHGKQYNKEIKNFIRAINPKVKFVIGGPTAYDAESNNDFDYVIVGYADSSVVNLANNLLGNEPLEKSRKSIFGSIVIDDSKAENFNFVSTKGSYKDYDGVLNNEPLYLEVSRGCIFRCAFCSFPLNGKKKLDYIRSADILYDELVENYTRFNTTTYFFSDDTFNDSPEKCKMIYDISKKLPFKLNWWAFLRLDLLKAHPETIDWIFEGGCVSAFFGIETLSSTAGKIIGKGGSRTELFKVLHSIKDRYGNRVSLLGSFIFGLPGESLEEMKATSDFLQSDKNPLDSWKIIPLNLKDNFIGFPIEFLSEFELNPKKYGYRAMPKDNALIKKFQDSRVDSIYAPQKFDTTEILWENDYTNIFEVKDLLAEIALTSTSTIPGRVALTYAGLGLGLEEVLNKRNSDMDWGHLDRLKLKRAREYKKIIYDGLNIPAFVTNDEINDPSFSSWIYKNNH